MSIKKENSTFSHNEQIIHEECDLIYALDKLGGRWKLYILSKLYGRIMRYKDLRNEIHPINERMFTLQLRTLEDEKLIRRKVYPEVPPRVEYELTDFANTLVPIWELMKEWGAEHKKIMKKDLNDEL